MLIYVTVEGAEIAGTSWPAGTRLEAPERAAKAAIANGVASFEVPDAKEAEAPKPSDETQPVEPPKKRGRPAKS